MKKLTGKVITHNGYTHSNKNRVVIEVLGEENYFGNMLKIGHVVTIMHDTDQSLLYNPSYIEGKTDIQNEG